MSQNRNFFSSIFDFKFDHFITPKLIKFLYVFWTVTVSLFTIVGLFYSIALIARGSFIFVLMIPGIFLVSMLIMIGIRSWFEFVLVIFKIKEYTQPRN
jgi:hypothetical protein